MIDPSKGWIGVDLDGTLAYHVEGQGLNAIGDPIPAMMRRVWGWLDAGYEVRILTARANAAQWGCEGAVLQIATVQDWLERHGLPRLVVTCEKDCRMYQLWDDRAVTVEKNTGRRLTP